MFWEKDFETLSRPELEKLQLSRLRKTLHQASHASYYGSLFRALGLSPESIKSLDDVRKLPLTSKQDLRDNFPYGFLTLSKRSLVRLHSSSGTTGNPTVVFHNRHDIDSWSNLMARSLYCAGVRDSDVFQNICGYGLFTGGLGFQYGAERLGCLSIPAGAGNSPRQIKLMRDYGTTVAHAIPSYLNRLYEVFQQEGLEPREATRLRAFVIGAEPHSEEQRRRIEEMFGVKAYNSFGLSEMNGPGVAFECRHQNGLHVWEDAFLVEILDPETLEPVADGDFGELVMTTLDREAMPLVRYRTRDLTRILPGPCPCGRTHVRLDRIVGRSDDMFIIKGCNVFPMQIESVLMKVPGVGAEYLITLDTINGADEMLLEAETSGDSGVAGGAEMGAELGREGDQHNSRLDALARSIGRRIRDEVLVTPIVRLRAPGSLPRSEGKAVRVKDLRARSL